MRFQDGCEKDITSNQLTAVTVDSSLVTEESNFTAIYAMPDEKVDLEKEYYYGVYIVL